MARGDTGGAIVDEIDTHPPESLLDHVEKISDLVDEARTCALHNYYGKDEKKWRTEAGIRLEAALVLLESLYKRMEAREKVERMD